jgi:hypothetical protein
MNTKPVSSFDLKLGLDSLASHPAIALKFGTENTMLRKAGNHIIRQRCSCRALWRFVTTRAIPLKNNHIVI